MARVTTGDPVDVIEFMEDTVNWVRYASMLVKECAKISTAPKVATRAIGDLRGVDFDGATLIRV